MSKPLAIELFAGMFGWGRGFVAEGWRVVGFDIEHLPHHGPVPEGCSLVLQDVLTLHGSQFREAECIVASPPCQAYSYRAMPWRRAKALPPPNNELFDACFRIQHEASQAARRYIPLVIENVKGAQPWVGRAKWHYGSFYLWGDVPALMPTTASMKKYGVKRPGMNWSGSDKPGYKAVAFNESGRKLAGDNSPRLFSERRAQRRSAGITEGADVAYYLKASGSQARKAASAAIAKIPEPLARHIARVYHPHT